MTTFTFHADPGHAWLRVSPAALRALDLTPEAFSSYSYKGKTNFYLEEDWDAPLFLNAYKAKHGIMPTIRETHAERSRVRNMERIH
tara:strand:+ start:237 stop:494 length:258 start_codon:yes stop_codon:yes gene_type:complete